MAQHFENTRIIRLNFGSSRAKYRSRFLSGTERWMAAEILLIQPCLAMSLTDGTKNATFSLRQLVAFVAD